VALPDPEIARPGEAGTYLAPRDGLEQALATWFAEVLRVDRVGGTDNFFELGGDSLMAIRVLSQVRDAFRAAIAIPQLFRAPTVRELAGLLRAALPEGQADRVAAALRRLQTMSPAEKQAMLQRRSG
jgi:acyl carrier protein